MTITNNTYKFNVQNNLFEPGIEINYKINFIGIKLNAGYLFQSGSDNFSVIDPTNNTNISLGPVKPNWNGYRVGFSIYYNLPPKAKKAEMKPVSK